MNALSFRATGIFLAIFSFAERSDAITYVATILHPVGYDQSEALGATIGYQIGYGSTTSGTIHASMWNGTANSVVDLNPPAFNYSIGKGISVSMQVGYAWITISNSSHAILWSGNASSAIDLNPTGVSDSKALGVSDATQVGYGAGSATGSNFHAFLWNGTAESAIDLNPTGFSRSFALAVSGGTQVGHGAMPGFGDHAILWHGTASSAIDLNPSGFNTTSATGVSGEYQVGYGEGLETGGGTHAILWHGTATNYVDLNHFGFIESAASAISAAGEVGWGRGFLATALEPHAMYWSGTAESVVDLHKFLVGTGMRFNDSHATGIADDGSIVGYASDTNGNQYAILWTPVPEPRSYAVIGFAFSILLFIRKRRTVRLSRLRFKKNEECCACYGYQSG